MPKDEPPTPVERVVSAMEHVQGLRETLHQVELSQLYIPTFAFVMVFVSSLTYARYPISEIRSGGTLLEVTLAVVFMYNWNRRKDLRVALAKSVQRTSFTIKDALAQEARLIDQISRKV